jgi:hypothetical protein
MMVDAAGEVSRAIGPYRSAIDGILREVAGDPDAVWRVEAAYRSGASSSTQVAANVTTVSSGLGQSWQGPASSAYAGASQNLTGRLDHVQSTLSRQAEAMAQVAQAQLQARGGVEWALRGLDAAEKSLLAASRNLPPAAVPQLIQQAQQAGAQYQNAAVAQREGLAGVLRQAAASLNQAAAAPPAAPVNRQQQKRRAADLTDSETMYNWLYGCVVENELRLGPDGKRILEESRFKTVAGPRASMATPNQTTMLNAVGVLLKHPEFWQYANPPLTEDELKAAKRRMDRVQEVWDSANAAERVAAAKERAEVSAIEARDKARAALANAEAAANTPDASAAAQKKVADLRALLAQREDKVLKAEMAAGRAQLAAQPLIARPETVVNNRNMTDTGLTEGDLKNMILLGLRARVRYNRLNANEQAYMAKLEAGLGADNRVTEDIQRQGKRPIQGTLTTFVAAPGEDRAGWQRKAVDSLDLGKGSVGQRINQIATHGDHRLLTDSFLRAEMARIRQTAQSDDAVVEAMCRVNNGSGAKPEYINKALKCYRAKKAAAAAKAAAPGQ